MSLLGQADHPHGEVTMTGASELERQDLFRVGDRLVRLVSEPETVHRGLSLFDDFTVLVGLRVQAVDDPRCEAYLILAPDELVGVLGAECPPTHARARTDPAPILT